MPWQLTTPYDGGDLDPTGTYDRVRISMLRWDARRQSITVSLEYGTVTDDDWIDGIQPAGKISSYTFQDTEYTDLLTHVSLVDELTYDAVKRGIYGWLNTNGYLDAGSLV